MKMDCLLAGVGGQGTVLASKIIAQTAMEAGACVRTSETIGMAQRGGSVVSHVRIGQRHCGPAVPKEKANLLIGFEPAEAVRNFPYLRRQGAVLANVQPVMPVTASLGGAAYDVTAVLAFLEERAGRVVFIDGKALCEKAGSAKVLNVIMLGAAIREGLLPFDKAQIMGTIARKLPPKFVDLNSRAFEIGYTYKD